MTQQEHAELDQIEADLVFRQAISSVKASEAILFRGFYPRVPWDAVPFAKRRAVAITVALLAKDFTERIPEIRWFEDPNESDMKSIELWGELPYEVLFHQGKIRGAYQGSNRTIWLHAKQSLSTLVFIVGHEWAHYLGVNDESECDAFGRDIARKYGKAILEKTT